MQYNVSRFMRYVPLLTEGPRAVDQPYRLYLTKVVRSGNVRSVLRTICYLMLYFCVNRWRRGELSARGHDEVDGAAKAWARIRCLF